MHRWAARPIDLAVIQCLGARRPRWGAGRVEGKSREGESDGDRVRSRCGESIRIRCIAIARCSLLVGRNRSARAPRDVRRTRRCGVPAARRGGACRAAAESCVPEPEYSAPASSEARCAGATSACDINACADIEGCVRADASFRRTARRASQAPRRHGHAHADRADTSAGYGRRLLHRSVRERPRRERHDRDADRAAHRDDTDRTDRGSPCHGGAEHDRRDDRRACGRRRDDAGRRRR